MLFKQIDELQGLMIQMSKAVGIPVKLDKDGNVIMAESSTAPKEGDLMVTIYRQQEKERKKREKQAMMDGLQSKMLEGIKKSFTNQGSSSPTRNGR